MWLMERHSFCSAITSELFVSHCLVFGMLVPFCQIMQRDVVRGHEVFSKSLQLRSHPPSPPSSMSLMFQYHIQPHKQMPLSNSSNASMLPYAGGRTRFCWTCTSRKLIKAGARPNNKFVQAKKEKKLHTQFSSQCRQIYQDITRMTFPAPRSSPH